MGGVGRILVIVVVVLLGGVLGGYFLAPSVASRSQDVDVARPPQSVLARLASFPPGSVVAEGVTVSGPPVSTGDSVSVPVTYADGAEGRVVYSVTPTATGSRVRVVLEQDLGANPLQRWAAIAGGNVAPLIDSAAQSVEADLGALPSASFESLNYEIVRVREQAFFYLENCSREAELEDVTVAQAAAGISRVMAQYDLAAAGPLTVIEQPTAPGGQDCYRIGYPYAGPAPRALTVGRTGQTPGGEALRIIYRGSQADVGPQVYDRIDALLAAAQLDDPSVREDDWLSYEVYRDDPNQPGGSRYREIYFVAPQGSEGLLRLSAIAPPVGSTNEPWRECLDDIECVIRCYQFDSEEGECPPRDAQIARLFREGHAAYRDPPSELEIGEWTTIVFALSRTETPVTPQSTQARQPLQPAGEAPSASDNPAVAAARGVDAPGASTSVSTEGVPTLPFLSATLDAPGFEVVEDAANDAPRLCRVGAACVWRWRLRALTPGERTLTVTLNGYLSEEDARAAQPLEPSHTHRVRVEISPAGIARVGAVGVERYGWGLFAGAATVLGAISSWLAIAAHRRRKRRASADSAGDD